MDFFAHNYACNAIKAKLLSPKFTSNHDKLYTQPSMGYSLPASSRRNFIRCCLQEVDSAQKHLEKPVKVVGLGSRRNDVLDFCLSSPLISSSVEFWTMHSGESDNVQIFQKVTGNLLSSVEGATSDVLEDELAKHQLCLGSAIVLVAGTGFGSDDKAAAELLKAAKSNGGLAVSIITKPFSFEGARRQNEVDELITKLNTVANLSIVVESDALLKRETVTLTEALRIANNAVLLAITAVSSLVSDSSHLKVLDIMPDCSNVVSTSDVLNILKHSGKAALGFGAGYSVKASVERAAFDCPFLSGGLIQGLKDIVICVVASAEIMDKKDVQAAVRAFRQIAKSSAKIICSTALEPALEPNIIVTTIIITGLEGHEAAPKLNFWSQLSFNLLLPFSLFRGEFRSKQTDSQTTPLSKEPPCLKGMPSTSQRTLSKSSQKPLIHDVFSTTECEDVFKTFVSCSNNDSDGFRYRLSCTSKYVPDKTAVTLRHIGQDSSTINNVFDDSCSNIEGDIYNREVAVQKDSMQSFHMSPKMACDFEGINMPELDSVHEMCNKHNLDHVIQFDNLSANAEARSEAIQCKLTSSSTNKANLCASSEKDDFQKKNLEGNSVEGVVASAIEGERYTDLDQVTEPQSSGLQGVCFKECASDKIHQWIPIMEESINTDNDNLEYAEPHGSASIHNAELVDKERLVFWNEEMDLPAAEAWAHIRAGAQKNLEKDGCMDAWRLPIGVKLTKQDKNGNHFPVENSQDKAPLEAVLSSWSGLADAGLGAVMDIYHAASALVLRKDMEDYTKQGHLSERAASMLETERGSKKMWTPVIEMQYRGGTYKGRCQGGLPEGKGRLSYVDGSFYDGLWKHGKRSGTGAFYFSSGDVFQGSWRDDLMHGKGWFYFHNGDRWFADFWKGKANGEGRYYSKHGEVFFGHFKDNWRHGKSLYIESNGARWYEVWEQGVLIHRTKENSTL
eukprot:Gb_30424 [translate_table: standard]